MTGTALHLAGGILAAVNEEPSKTPFYVAGGLFAVWAVALCAIGLRNADFPASSSVARLVMGVSLVGILATASLAIATSSKPKAEHKAEAGEEVPAAGDAATTIPLAADPTGQ